MARFLIQASYNTGGISDLIRNPQDRAAAIRPVVESLGGKLISFDYSFGEYDVAVIFEAVDDTTMAAVAIAIGAGGAIKSAKTTPLLSGDEWVAAMTQASSVTYTPAR